MNTQIRQVEVNGKTHPIVWARMALTEGRVRQLLGIKGDAVTTISGPQSRKLRDYALRAVDSTVVGSMRKGTIIYLFDGLGGPGIFGQWDRATMAD